MAKPVEGELAGKTGAKALNSHVSCHERMVPLFDHGETAI